MGMCISQYLMSTAKGVRYKVEHEKRYSISPTTIYYFVYYINIMIKTFLKIF